MVSNLIRVMTAHGLVTRWRSDTDRRPTRYRTVSKAVLDGAFDPAPD